MIDSPAARIATWISLLLLALPAVASAANDDAARLEAKREEWVQKYEELRSKTQQLEADLDQARVDYSRGRSTKHLRGEGKAGLLEEIARLEKELAESQAELQAFPDEARKQGALPGWFRDGGDETPAAQADGGSGRDSRFGSTSSDSRSLRSRQEREEPPEAEASDGGSSHESLSDRRAKSRERRRLGRD
jgi:hypothetical protein